MKSTQQPVAIGTGASSGIGLGLTHALLERGYRVIANSRSISRSKELKSSEDLGIRGGQYPVQHSVAREHQHANARQG
jgi:NAD(P)-dependent dehydrogenase (short-subunit alcohol dehydrogenase family)